MTGNADAAVHVFGAPDEESAVMIAQALSRFGFHSVAVHSSDRSIGWPTTGEWEVTALDDGPYFDDDTSERVLAAIRRYAIAVAVSLGGRHIGGTRCAPKTLQWKALSAEHLFESGTLAWRQ